MPESLPLIGLYGKVPAHGDFVRRGLPSSFVGPWDAWLRAGVTAARDHLGAHWTTAWDGAPAWRFALPPGACGPDAAAGVMVPSQDQVGRRFPIMLAALLPPGAPMPDADWYDAVEATAMAGLAGRADADALVAAMRLPGEALTALPFALPSAIPAAAVVRREDDAPHWTAGEAPRPLSTSADPVDDGLALLSAAALPDGESPPTIDGPDVLALLTGEAAGTAQAADAGGTLAGLIGAAAAAPADPGLLPRIAVGSAEPFVPRGAGDGILMELIGAAGTDPPSGPDTAIGAGDATPLLALIGSAADSAGGHDGDLLPATVPTDWPDPAGSADGGVAAAALGPSVAAPPAPEGGGWWTRGGAHMPPLVWPLPGLPSPAEFVHLLEAAA
jgi:type VI secretion system protein ImpM